MLREEKGNTGQAAKSGTDRSRFVKCEWYWAKGDRFYT